LAYSLTVLIAVAVTMGSEFASRLIEAWVRVALTSRTLAFLSLLPLLPQPASAAAANAITATRARNLELSTCLP
jgi:hypothetical protein